MPILSKMRETSHDSKHDDGSGQFASTITSVPDDFGLLIFLSEDGSVCFNIQEDANLPHIHRNCYAPKELKDTRLLHGGGSGTAVFYGCHPILGKVVGKHGHQGDTREVMALAHIASELEKRAKRNPDCNEAARRMKARIPEFMGVYISKHHLRSRTSELGKTVRHESFGREIQAALSSGGMNALDESMIENFSAISPEKTPSFMQTQSENNDRRDLHVVRGGEDVGLEVLFRRADLCVPELDQCGVLKNGHHFLEELTPELFREQQQNFWKFSLFQKLIGGDRAENGADILVRGKLVDSLEKVLLTEMLSVLEDLKALTTQEEKYGVQAVRDELEQLRQSRDPAQVSNATNTFCGSAIRKNFLPERGRFYKLREFGQLCRKHEFILTDLETLPISFLGRLLQKGAELEEVFVDAPYPQSALDQVEDSWLDLLEHAAGITTSSAHERIWSCGLTDAGLHNTFLGMERGLELFDLGEPGCMPQPAFLTKFLMSFFHTLGMQDDGHGQWVNRFTVTDDGLLSLSDATKAILPRTCKSFQAVLGHFMSNVFGGESKVRALLVKYVVLQLLSDSSFCLSKWERKGGGQARIGEAVPLQKWLWRALWDFYVATFVHFHDWSDDAEH